MTTEAERARAREAQRRRRAKPGVEALQAERRKTRYRTVEYARRRVRREDNSEWPKMVISQVRWRAKDTGIPFEITASDIPVPELCPVLGIPLKSGTGKPCPNNPSVDRIDPNKGYTKDNVRVISRKANWFKSNVTLGELKAIISYIEESVPRQVSSTAMASSLGTAG